MDSILGPRVILFVVLSAFGCLPSQASTFKTLVLFNGANGANPVDTSLVQGPDGYLYGTTDDGGAHNAGTVFKMTPAGEVTVIHSFCSLANCADGSGPYGGLVLARDGNFYGTTVAGGAVNFLWGTIFKITAAGELTTIHSFAGTDGARPYTPLTQAANGALYGLTTIGGTFNSGTFFKITLQGTLSTLFSFDFYTDLIAPLVQGSDGNFYGTSAVGGVSGDGLIFKLTPEGTFSILHSFDATDGSTPEGGLLQASDGNLYGTTNQGGANNSCRNGCGTVFKITLAGEFTTLYDFDSAKGANPIATLIEATDGNLYGTTYAGGTGNWGTIFKMTRAGIVTALHSFQGSDGAQPFGPLSQDTSGKLYGTATHGTASQGAAFLIAAGLRPFVSFLQNPGYAGQNIGILGQGLEGTTSVYFGTASASFKKISGTFLIATVPVGATTALVTVATATESLKSNVRFRVLQ